MICTKTIEITDSLPQKSKSKGEIKFIFSGMPDKRAFQGCLSPFDIY